MNKPRRGVSLAELLVVMIACTVVISLSTQLLCRAMRAQVESRGHAAVERNALRLSRHFRRDVHQAQVVDVTPTADDILVRLDIPDDRVAEYSHQDGTIVRRLIDNDKLLAVEEFDFPGAIECDIKQVKEPARLVLTITARPFSTSVDDQAPSTPAPRNPINLCVAAVLGRDSQLSPAAPGEEDGQ